MRRKAKSSFYCLADRGWFGLTPLETHIIVCGYPRSGTTLLLAMLEHAFPAARCFGREVSGWRAAAYSWRSHSQLISKAPNDVFCLDQLQAFYHERAAQIRPIILVRDPRDVLTSHHVATGPDAYFLDLEFWQSCHAQVQRHWNDPNVMTLRYEDFVGDVASTQVKIEQFASVKAEHSFDEFHFRCRRGFDTAALNGVRPVDRNGIGRWRLPQHQARVEELLREVPSLTEILVELGYERDRSWIRDYRRDLLLKSAAADHNYPLRKAA